jgi:hypothetical protein
MRLAKRGGKTRKYLFDIKPPPDVGFVSLGRRLTHMEQRRAGITYIDGINSDSPHILRLRPSGSIVLDETTEGLGDDGDCLTDAVIDIEKKQRTK